MGRKIVCLLMTLVLVLGLVACGDMSGSEPDSTPVFSDVENEEVPTTTTTEDENELDATPTTTTTTEAEEEETTKRTTTTTKKKTTAKTTKKTTKKSTKKSTTTTKKSTKKSTTTTKKPTTTTTKRPTTTTVPQPKMYGAGQTWKVPGQFEFTINSVQEHYVCDDGGDNYNGAVSAVIIDCKWQNLGYDTKLIFDDDDFEVYDQQKQQGEDRYFEIYCDHGRDPGEVIVGGVGSALFPVALYNDNNSYVTIFVEKGNYSATFKIPVTEAPPEPEEDKLEGCTITVDNDLPETFSYSNSYPEKYTSSCSVTEVTFEVSGEDLYMYFSGRKIYDSRGSGQSDQCAISWKLYDDDTNTVIATGTAYTLSLAEGEGFVKTKDEAYDCITPGGNYRLLLLNTN